MLAVYHNNKALLMTREALDALGLRDGQHIDEPMLWRAIDANSASLRGRVEANLKCDPQIRAAFDRVQDELEIIVVEKLGR